MADQSDVMPVAEKGMGDVNVIHLDRHVYMLGKSPTADIVPKNSYVSRRQGQITQEGGRFQIRDLESKNGTFIIGCRLGGEGQWLLNGDLIEQCIRRIRLRIELDPSRPQCIFTVRGYNYRLCER